MREHVRLVTMLLVLSAWVLTAAPAASAQAGPESGSALQAPAVGMEPSSASSCSTYQYQVVSDATVRHSPGGAVKAHLDADGSDGRDFIGAIGNVSQTSGSWYYGNWYQQLYAGGEVFVASGWVLAEKLSYIRCW